MYDFLGKKSVVFSDVATMGSVSNSHEEVRVRFVGARCYYAMLVTSVGFCKLHHVLCEHKLQVGFLCLSTNSVT